MSHHSSLLTLLALMTTSSQTPVIISDPAMPLTRIARPFRYWSTPVNGVTTFNSLYSGSFVDLTGIHAANGAGLAANDVAGYNFRLFASSGAVDCGIGIEPFTGQTALVYGYTQSGATNLTALDLSSNDGKIFDLQSVGITIDGSILSSAKNVQLVGYLNGNPVPGATLTQSVLGASWGGLLVTFNVSANSNFIGIDKFRVQTDGSFTIDGAIGVDNVNAINFRPAGSLPVTLTDYSGQAAPDGTAQLKWQTAMEVNNSRYVVERSADGKTFTPIGTVAPKQAPGTAGPTDYSFTDLRPFAGVNFYRLVQYDIDGNKKYLGIVVVTFSASDRVHIFPNPVDGDLLSLVLDKDPAKGETYTLVTASGSMVQTGAVSSRSQGIDMSRLPKGLYVLKLSDGRSFKVERR